MKKNLSILEDIEPLPFIIIIVNHLHFYTIIQEFINPALCESQTFGKMIEPITDYSFKVIFRVYCRSGNYSLY